MKYHAEEQHSVHYREYKKLNRQSKLDYFKELEELRPLAALIRNNPALLMAKAMIVLNISRNIVKVIIHHQIWVMIQMILLKMTIGLQKMSKIFLL